MVKWGPHLPKWASPVTRGAARNWTEFETDYGPPLISKRGTASESSVSAEIVCPRAEADALFTFFRIDCEDGTSNFERENKTYRWAEPPVRVDYSTFSRVSISLMRQPS